MIKIASSQQKFAGGELILMTSDMQICSSLVLKGVERGSCRMDGMQSIRYAPSPHDYIKSTHLPLFKASMAIKSFQFSNSLPLWSQIKKGIGGDRDVR